MCRSVRDVDLILSVVMSQDQRNLDPEMPYPTYHARSSAEEKHTDRALKIGYVDQWRTSGRME
jgi:Asp-tRNA(Asn)/Glu-tRNA(Gln) amidotransferase A subunit family amidase